MGLFDRFRLTTDNRSSETRNIKQQALDLIDEGNTIEETGQLAQAMQRYDEAVRLAPDLARGHMNRGNILLATGDLEGAVAAYLIAVKLEPDYAAAHYNLGHAHLRLNHQGEAQAAYKKAILLKEDFVDAHVALGCVLEDLEALEESAGYYRKALAIAPNYAEVHGNLGNILNKQGQFTAAASSYKTALAINPELLDIQLKLGQTLKGLNQNDEAIACFRAVLKRAPQNSDAHFLLGMTLKELGQLDSAAASLRLAIANDANNPEKQINLGDILGELGHPDKAVACYEQALRIKPDHAVAYSNLGNIRLASGSFDDAMACYQQAIDIQPDFAAAHNNLGATFLILGYPTEALASTRRALELLPNLAAAQSNIVFIENSIALKPPSQLLDEAKKYGEIVAGKAKAFTAWPNEPNVDRILRIGFVSGDLRDHPVGHFVEGFLRSLTSSENRLEIHAYTTFNCSDHMSRRIKASCREWNAAAHVSDEVLANKIRGDKIDILIDLSGHTAHNRLSVFAWKPAPIQVTWLGYLATTGVNAIDYLIADEWTLPDTEECNFTEKIWRLPKSYLCFTPPQSGTTVSPIPALKNGYITFGCFNNLTKISNDVIELWAIILTKIPNSRLILKAKQFIQESVKQKTNERFAVHGIGAERLTLIGQVAREEYLVPYQQIDIALDPFPYPGITTTVESLWMGVPVITLAGSSFISRQGVGLMMNAGLPEWIANSADEYVTLAIKHASDLNKLSKIRSALRDRISNSPIFDSVQFAKNFENALRSMWSIWCSANRGTTKASSWTFSQSLSSTSQVSYEIKSVLPEFTSFAQNTDKARSVSKNLINLHIGGREAKPGWKILNALKFEGVDYVGDIRNLSSFDDACCAKVYASHVMEHVSQKDFLETLKGIHRILCDGGEFYFSVPDLQALCKLFLDPKLDGQQRFHVMRMIFGGQVDDYDFHFIGLTEEFMVNFFRQAGFSSAQRVNALDLFNDTSSYQVYNTSISLNMIAVK